MMFHTVPFDQNFDCKIRSGDLQIYYEDRVYESLDDINLLFVISQKSTSKGI